MLTQSSRAQNEGKYFKIYILLLFKTSQALLLDLESRDGSGRKITVSFSKEIM